MGKGQRRSHRQPEQRTAPLEPIDSLIMTAARLVTVLRRLAASDDNCAAWQLDAFLR